MKLSQILMIAGFILLITSVVFGVIHHLHIENPHDDLTHKDMVRISLIQSETMSLSIVLFVLACLFK